MLNDLEQKTALFIPTLNGGNNLTRFLNSLKKSTFKPARLFAIDSGSSDDTKNQLIDSGFEVEDTDRNTFTHGKVRRDAFQKLVNFKYVVMVTQDIELTEKSLEKLVTFLDEHEKVAVTYGRQTAIEQNDGFSQDKYDKSINYPTISSVKSLKDRQRLGIKTVTNSDAFSVYRTSMVQQVGSFPTYVHFSEDLYMAALFINSGFEVGYCAEAEVHHSNFLPKIKLYQRYHQIGKFHKQFPWIQQEFGKAEGAGIPLVLKQIRNAITRRKLVAVFNIIVNSGIKYLGFKSSMGTKAIETKPRKHSRIV